MTYLGQLFRRFLCSLHLTSGRYMPTLRLMTQLERLPSTQNYERPKQQRQGVSKISNDSRSCKMGKPPKISAQNASCDHYMCRSNKNIWLSLPIVYPSVSNPPRQDRRRHIPQALAMNSQVSIKPRRPSSLLLHCLLILRPGVTTPLGVD